MGPSLREYGSWMSRPATRDRPTTKEQAMAPDHSLMIPSRHSSLHSRITAPSVSHLSLRAQHQPQRERAPKTLTHAYMVCGLGREPSQWVKAPAPSQGRIGHMKGAVGQFWLPDILGSSPRLEQDNEVARSLYAAMRFSLVSPRSPNLLFLPQLKLLSAPQHSTFNAYLRLPVIKHDEDRRCGSHQACFPHDVEICTGRAQPHCVHHCFVLQQDATQTLYGIALRVWSRADEKRAETIREMRRRTDTDSFESPDETYWIPYCLSFLSRYPLYDLLGDYLRGMWIHWNKATNLFHAEEVSRILSFPAPRLNDLVRIDMRDFALCYQFPCTPTGFQNFSLWPLFSCLSIPNLVGVIEAALSATRRLIFLSHHPAMLTMATETVRQCVRVYEWSGLYVPIVHARHVKDLVQEPGPYMLGISAECRTLFTAPPDALVIDLDRNYVMTSVSPSLFSIGQRNKMIGRLTDAFGGHVEPSGVPQHLRSAYSGGKLVPAGQIIVMRGHVEAIEAPSWWNQDAVLNVMDHVCEKLSRNTGVKALFSGSAKKPLMTKVSMRHLNEIVREKNQYSRDAMEAWQDLINLKTRMDTELNKVTKRNNFLVDELDSWKQQFLKFQAFAEQLTKETQDLKLKIDSHKREHRRLSTLVDQHKSEAAKLALRLTGTEKQRDDALQALVLQQEMAEELDRERKRNKKELSALNHTNATLMRQRDESQRVVIHLRALIDGQTHHMEHIVRSLGTSSVEEADDNKSEGRSWSRNGHRLSRPVEDTVDRNLRERTDAIADIIRNIGNQCAAAVEGLHLAHGMDENENRDQIDPVLKNSTSSPVSRHSAGMSTVASSTPDLTGRNSLTSLSRYSASTNTTVERDSVQWESPKPGSD